jgi:D-2-hydroxyacid dehydrogenase (NADP+)
MLPSKDQLTICFAHIAYRLRERFLTPATGIESFEVRDSAALEPRIGEADVLVISGLWRNDLLPRAKRLRFIQSIGAGTDQFSLEALKQHGVRLASVPLASEDSQIGVRMRVCRYGQDRAHPSCS